MSVEVYNRFKNYCIRKGHADQDLEDFASNCYLNFLERVNAGAQGDRVRMDYVYIDVLRKHTKWSKSFKVSQDTLNMNNSKIMDVEKSLFESQYVKDNNLESSSNETKQDKQDKVDYFLNSLTGSTRIVFMLHFRYDFKQSDIADILGVSPGRISQIIELVTSKRKNLLNANLDPDFPMVI